ncbi:DsbA family oxidoreductase [Ralstonia chuxiongensis]|uniref:DsbA family oxidoreductase n=1 Tax=Ralstonia chuxiongensis TaxID=2957504 RepID=A0AA41WZS5_9RALS|nr:DsbA family oxidoreductase [Ralstonia chuxiongensis]MCP1175853.1 DsbA family oxidoreductase [Ralstonia chuxiongensis]
MKQVTVEVWSDFVCPWCWIAKRRFEKAVQALEGQLNVVVIPKAYRLAKGMPPTDFKTVAHRKFGNAEAAEQLMEAIRTNGDAENLKYEFDTMRFGDTSDAHALVKSIQSPVDSLRMIERIYRAGTTEGIDIFDRAALLSLAREIGISVSSVDFDSPRIAAEIAREELQANRIAHGVPLFVFNGKAHVSGARSPAAFESALLEAAAHVDEFAAAEAGASCSIDGCSIEPLATQER